MLLKKRATGWQPKYEDTIGVLVNNLGGLSVLEQQVIAEEILQQLGKVFVSISRVIIGTYVTSLNGPGFSLTLLKLDDEITTFLDAPTTAPAWPQRSLVYNSDALQTQLVVPTVYTIAKEASATSLLTGKIESLLY
jgi:triose/dihydroxyacetone kinase / FAD-AMP lyase (cyclizing)